MTDLHFPSFFEAVRDKAREMDHNHSDEEFEEWFEEQPITNSEEKALGEYSDDDVHDYASSFIAMLDGE